MSILSEPHFHNEKAAYAWVEKRLWPNGPVCPKCGENKRVGKLKGKSTRIGVHKCYSCRKPFTVKVGTVFEDSHIPLHKWLQTMHLMVSSKKGISANQIHRTLKIDLKSAWFLAHRIREAMRAGGLSVPMGGTGSSGIVEADETFTGRKKGVPKPKGGVSHKHAVLSLVERGGKVKSVHVGDVRADTLLPIIKENIDKEAKIMTDDAAAYYQKLGDFASHETVSHVSGEYVRGEVHTNTVEGYFSIFKRGMKGVYQHCSERHLHRYLAEFDFRYNNRVRLGVDDEQRAERLLQGVKGKRLTFRTTKAEAVK